ncbi:hypothetical protein GUY61_33195 [Streptomyces sp. GC420]|nr:hypothetical protein [Streptomyces sp. GC420]
MPEPGAGRPAPGSAGRTRRWPWLVAAAVALALAGGGAAGIMAMRQDGTEAGGPGSSPLPPPGYPRPGGPYLVRLAHSGLCLSERAEDQTGQVFQAPCETALPAYSLEFEEGGRWRIATDHPDFGPGCTGIRQGAGEEGAPVEDDYCGTRGQSEEFRLERVAGRAGGYRLRPLHSGLCLSVPGGTKEAWAPVRQLDCGKGEGARGQVFRFDPV